LRAILDSPGDDAVRLVYADWLEDHGEPDRAEFIRLQLSPEPRSEAREDELCLKLFGHLDDLQFGITFRRGFVESIRSGFVNFRDRAARLRPEDAPAFALVLEKDKRDRELDETSYEGFDRAVGEMGERPELRRCVSLDLPCLNMDASSYLLESGQFVNLRRLNFPNSEAGPSLELLDSPTFADLRWLNLKNSNSAEGPASFGRLTVSRHLANLEYLDFGRNRVDSDDLQSLIESCELPNLRTLILSDNHFSRFQVSWTLFWADVDELPALRELDLSASFDNLTDLTEAVDDPEETRNPLIARLEKLALRRNGITDAGAKVIARCPWELRLTHLDLRDNPIGESGKRALRRRFGKGTCRFGAMKPDD
jgi:uncharacterized protein (TIGR02996 family)